MSFTPSAHFFVELSQQTGSLERLMGRIRRRGFSVENMIVTRTGRELNYRIELRLSGQRCFEILARHLANLIDVQSLSHQKAEFGNNEPQASSIAAATVAT